MKNTVGKRQAPRHGFLVIQEYRPKLRTVGKQPTLDAPNKIGVTNTQSENHKNSIMHTHQLKGGRILAYEVYGDPKGYPVIFSHGLSDSRLIRHFDDDYTRTLGVRIIAVDQPGVGGSTDVPAGKRTLMNYARDVESLVDALKLDKFAVAGHSGGGPHSLAIAVHMPDRVTRGSLAGPLPPLNLPGVLDLFAFPGLSLLPAVMRYFSFLIRLLCWIIAWWANRNISGYLQLAAELDRSDGWPETFLGEPKQTKLLHDSFTAGFEQGSNGFFGMLLAVLGEWEFTLKDVPQHFDIFFGDLDATLKPEMGQLLAKSMPDASYHSWRNGGHYAFCDRDFWGAFLSVLADKQ